MESPINESGFKNFNYVFQSFYKQTPGYKSNEDRIKEVADKLPIHYFLEKYAAPFMMPANSFICVQGAGTCGIPFYSCKNYNEDSIRLKKDNTWGKATFSSCAMFINDTGIESIGFTVYRKPDDEQHLCAEIDYVWYSEDADTFKHKSKDEISQLLNEKTEQYSFLHLLINLFPSIDQLFVKIKATDFDADNIGQSFFIFASDSKQNTGKMFDCFIIPLLDLNGIIKSVTDNSESEHVKAQKAAIMSRNMSHNIGSHVLAYLKMKLGSVADILGEHNDVLRKLYPEIIGPEDDRLNTFLVGLGRFIGYLQERQDYIATIATSSIPYGAPVNMKDAIYDEMNPDLRYLRHNQPQSSEPQNILLNYIAKSEGFSRENLKSGKRDIRMGFIKYESDSLSTTFGFGEKTTSEHLDRSGMRSINFSLPGGLIGRQAIFSILENIIRNAAKHGNTDSVDNLDFTFDLIDGKEVKDKSSLPGYKERIHDGKWRSLYENADDIDNLFLFSVTDNLTNSESSIAKIREGLTEPYIDEYEKAQGSKNKGIKEIRISAAWLRGETDENKYYQYSDDIGIAPQKHAPLVAVELTSDKHLRYIIAVKKNKTFAVIQTGIDENNLNTFKELQEKNHSYWTVFESTSSFLADTNTYSYILVGNQDIFNKIRNKTSNRIRVWKKNDNLSSENAASLIYQLFAGEAPYETLYIWDWTACKSHTEEHFGNISLCDHDEDDQNAQYAYRTHHSTRNEFLTFFSKKDSKSSYGQTICVDSITGENSSDRLVRRDPLDERWYYEHLHAFRQRIVIFDERLFRMIHGIDVNIDFNTSNNIQSHNYLCPYNKERGIEVLCIVKVNNDALSIIGCTESTCQDDSILNTIEEIATIAVYEKNNNSVVISWKNESFKNRFNYISIHQKMIDKIYKNLNFVRWDRTQFLKSLYESFMVNPTDRPEGDFLPSLTIHSGRSKPSDEEMSQFQPFIQYSAIANAISDSKYSLVELLDYAKATY